MLNITLDLDTGLAKLAVATTIKVGAPVPVTIKTVRGTTPASPGASPAFDLGLGTDATPPVLTAYLDEFAAENAHTFSGVLDANDTRLVAFMAGKGQVNLGCEIAWTVAGDLQVAPTFPIPVQPRIIPSDPGSEGGPSYYTEAEVDALLQSRNAPLDVADSAARLALTTASVRNGGRVREVGRAEITRLTCLGSTCTAAVAETTEITCGPDVAGSLNSTGFYVSTLTEGVYVWFNVATAGADPFIADRGIEIAIPTNETAVNIAIAIAAALDADADFSSQRVGAVVTVVNDDAGLTLYLSSDVDTNFTVTNPTFGTDAIHALQGTTLTLYNGTDTARTVGFSFAGNVGDIAVTLPAGPQTAAQIAALARTAIEAHADFSATVSTTEVTVTNAAKGWVRDAIAGTTGFTIAVLTQGVTGAITYILVDETLIASEAGWNPLPVLISFSASNATGTQTLSSATHTKLDFLTKDFDTHHQFNPMLRRFTCKVPGKYSLSAQIDLGSASSTSNRKILQIYKNGSAFKRLVDIYFTTSVGHDHIIDGTGVLFDLVVGDYIEAYAYAASGGTVYFDSAIRSFFQALRVGA